MWESIARFVLKFRILLLVILLAATGFMGYQASQVQLSYELSRAIPTDNPKYIAYQAFRKKFGEDGNLLVIGVQSDKIFQKNVFNEYAALSREIKQIGGVDQVLSIPLAIDLKKNDSAEKMYAIRVFKDQYADQSDLDSSSRLFFSVPFYQYLLYNPEDHTYLMAVNINKVQLNSARRNVIVKAITDAGDRFGSRNGIEMHYSGLPLIRTNMATKVASEMKLFLLASVILSACILLLFFRSVSTMILSLVVVLIGVVFSLGTMHLFDYKITLISVLIPPLVLVIGIPNCIYFLNKYHTAYQETGSKQTALFEMIRRMGVVTLFCNISAAIGFGVFAFTRSAILKEFGVVAGLNILILFFISVILIPSMLSFLPDPKPRHMIYLQNRWLTAILRRVEIWTLNHRAIIYTATILLLAVAILGMTRLKSVGFMVDDLPKKDPIYTDMKFFEKHFKGVMPLEVIVDTKRKNGLRSNLMQTLEKIDSLTRYIAAQPEMNRPLALTEGIKFVRQAYYNGDSASYGLPSQMELSFLAPYVNIKAGNPAGHPNELFKLLNSFIDSNREATRISINMADVGTVRLGHILDSMQLETSKLFDSTKYSVQLTGSSVTFLEGSSFIIHGLKESILWAFLLIAACMLYLFRSVKILLCSLIPNVIPLIITAGVMGWVGIPLKPSTVLVFSIALGIAIDITIRFLVNYKHEQHGEQQSIRQTVVNTIHHTGISIIYTSLVLIAGFGIFCFSQFGGTQALGWLTSLTLVMATLTNLIFLPALLLTLGGKQSNKTKN